MNGCFCAALTELSVLSDDPREETRLRRTAFGIEIRGTVAQDPEVRTTESGKKVVNLLVAAHAIERDGERLDPEPWKRVVGESGKGESYRNTQSRPIARPELQLERPVLTSAVS